MPLLVKEEQWMHQASHAVCFLEGKKKTEGFVVVSSVCAKESKHTF